MHWEEILLVSEVVILNKIKVHFFSTNYVLQHSSKVNKNLKFLRQWFKYIREKYDGLYWYEMSIHRLEHKHYKCLFDIYESWVEESYLKVKWISIIFISVTIDLFWINHCWSLPSIISTIFMSWFLKIELFIVRISWIIFNKFYIGIYRVRIEYLQLFILTINIEK